MFDISRDEAIGFVSVRLPEGRHSFTFTTLVGEFLNELEMKYGERDHSYTLLGIEFGGDTPCIWYPGNCKNVAIRLTDTAALEPARALFQLAHETVHLLSPTGSETGLVAEEGLATLFSHQATAAYDSNFQNDNPAYAYTEQTVLDWEKIDPQGIQTVRKVEPRFSSWTAATIIAVSPNTPENLAAALCEPFRDVKKRFSPIE